jgi:hypothetical protein
MNPRRVIDDIEMSLVNEMSHDHSYAMVFATIASGTADSAAFSSQLCLNWLRLWHLVVDHAAALEIDGYRDMFVLDQPALI